MTAVVKKNQTKRVNSANSNKKIQRQNHSAYELQPHGNNKIEKDKYFALWTGMIFFMAVFVFVWALMLNTEIKHNAVASQAETNFSEIFDKLNDSFNKTINNLSVLSKNDSQSTEQIDSDAEKIQQKLTEIKNKAEFDQFVQKFNQQIEEVQPDNAVQQ